MKKTAADIRNLVALSLALLLALIIIAAGSPASALIATGSAQDSYGATAGAADATADTTDPATGPATQPAGPADYPTVDASATAYGADNTKISGATPVSSGSNQPTLAVAETTPPVITAHTPANDAVTGTAAFFSADYYDPEPSSGIKPSTAMIHIDNRHQFGTVITDSRISLDKTGLTEGSHKIEAFICDNNYNCTVATWYITVDAVAPVFSSAQPSGTINARDTSITAGYSDGSGAGVAPSSAAVTLDGTAITAACAASATDVNCPVTGLTDGDHTVEVDVADLVGNHASKQWSFSVDTAAIGVSGQVPAAGSWLSTATPEIKADFQPVPSNPIDTASINVTLDGEDVSAVAGCGSTGISFAPAPQLAEGWHTVTVTLRDDAGHSGHAQWDFAVDTVAPQIQDTAPMGGALSMRPAVSATFSDLGSGIETEMISFMIDGVNQTGNSELDGGAITFTPTVDLSSGAHNVQLTVQDLAGNEQTSAWSFTVPAAQPAAAGPATVTTRRQVSVSTYWLDGVTGGGGGWVISGFPAFPNMYFLPWYDSGQTADGFTDEIVIGNDGAGEATVNVFVGGENKWQGKVAEGSSETCRLPEVTGGPVKIVCPTGQPLSVTHRVARNGAVSVTGAIAEEDMDAVLLLPAYESSPAGQGSAAIMIANTGDQQAAVDVYIGDPSLPESLKGHFDIGPLAAARAEFAEVSGGPVKIVCTNGQPLAAELRLVGAEGFSITPAAGLSHLDSLIELDPPGPGASGKTRLYLGNPGDSDADLEISVGEDRVNDSENGDSDTFVVSRQGYRTIDLPADSKVRIDCTNCSLGEGVVAAWLLSR